MYIWSFILARFHTFTSTGTETITNSTQVNKNYLSVENKNDSNFLVSEERKKYKLEKKCHPQTCFHCLKKKKVFNEKF